MGRWRARVGGSEHDCRTENAELSKQVWRVSPAARHGTQPRRRPALVHPDYRGEIGAGARATSPPRADDHERRGAPPATSLNASPEWPVRGAPLMNLYNRYREDRRGHRAPARVGDLPMRRYLAVALGVVNEHSVAPASFAAPPRFIRTLETAQQPVTDRPPRSMLVARTYYAPLTRRTLSKAPRLYCALGGHRADQSRMLYACYLSPMQFA